jgi:hypothetical protein
VCTPLFCSNLAENKANYRRHFDSGTAINCNEKLREKEQTSVVKEFWGENWAFALIVNLWGKTTKNSRDVANF